MNGAYGEGILAVSRLIDAIEVAAAYAAMAVVVLVVLCLANWRRAKW